MSDRLALANAIEDAGIERSKAERVASVIVDAIHDNVATKADVQASERGAGDLAQCQYRGDYATLRTSSPLCAISRPASGHPQRAEGGHPTVRATSPAKSGASTPGSSGWTPP